MVDADRQSSRAIERMERVAAVPRQIISRSISVSANRDRLRSGGRMPPVRDNSG